MTAAQRSSDVAEELSALLEKRGVRVALIGAAAMAVHGYARATEDIDLATHTDPFSVLREVESEARARGFSVELNLPDADDPLGGVLRVSGEDFSTIDVVNYLNPYRSGADALAREAIAKAAVPADGSCRLPVVDVPHLVALKLYAGGLKSAADVAELLQRNRGRVEEVRAVCATFGLTQDLERVLVHVR